MAISKKQNSFQSVLVEMSMLTIKRGVKRTTPTKTGKKFSAVKAKKCLILTSDTILHQQKYVSDKLFR